ncbi:MAG: hypothetical protein Q8O83_02655 [bacterium]|nr:hypothetical protein [bacterium]
MIILKKDNTEIIHIDPEDSLLSAIKLKLFKLGCDGTRFLFSKKECHFIQNKTTKYFFGRRTGTILLRTIQNALERLLIPSLRDYIKAVYGENARARADIIHYKRREYVAIIFYIMEEKDDWDPDWDG